MDPERLKAVACGSGWSAAFIENGLFATPIENLTREEITRVGCCS